MRKNKKFFLYLLVLLVCILVFFPIYGMLATSTQSINQITAYPPNLKFYVNGIVNYGRIFSIKPLALWMWNTFYISLIVTLFTLFIGGLAAYSFSRFRYKGKQLSMMILLITQMVPPVLLVVPLYIVFLDLKLIGNIASLYLSYLAFSLPVCTLFLKNFFDQIPVEIEEAAEIDGCTKLTALWRITMPLSLPGLSSTGMFSFVLSWNQFLFAYTFIHDPSDWVNSIGLSSFIGQYTFEWNQIMIASVIVTMPAMLIFGYLQKYLIAGFTTGAVKG